MFLILLNVNFTNTKSGLSRIYLGPRATLKGAPKNKRRKFDNFDFTICIKLFFSSYYHHLPDVSNAGERRDENMLILIQIKNVLANKFLHLSKFNKFIYSHILINIG